MIARVIKAVVEMLLSWRVKTLKQLPVVGLVGLMVGSADIVVARGKMPGSSQLI